MLPILPRQMLWKNKHSMDEFFKLDRINEAFYEVFVTLRNEPFAVQADEVKVFNEVYYQITRMVYDYPMPSDLPKYVSDIKANMGWNYSAELVMSMAYFLISLIDKHERPFNKFFTKAINEKFFGCLYWKPFKHRFEQLKKEKRHIKYSFKPSPVDVSWFKDKYIHWNEITRDYDLMCIEHVINLWSDVEDRREVAILINDSISYYTTKRNAADLAHLRHFMEIYMIAAENAPIWKCAEDSPWDENEKLKERIKEIENEKTALLGRISELEAENTRLNSLLEKKKRNGAARKFTLVEIVNYCKGCVAWEDVKSIVAMLNKLLRRIATDEDSDLVDSIESEFINRRYGNTNIANQTVIPSVGNYYNKVDTVENKFPSLPPMDDPDKMIE